jgi:hypothetical protein
VKENNNNKSVFFFCYYLTTVVFIIVNILLFLFVSFEAYAVSSQQPFIVSNNNNNLSNTPSDAIHKTVNAMVTNNMARLVNDTILSSSMTNPTSKVVATNNNSSQTTTNNTAGTMSSQSNSTNTSGAITKNNNNQTHMDIQKNASESINENESKRKSTIKSPIMAGGIIDSSQEQQLPALNNNTKTFADNQPVVLQIQKSTDTDIANKLEDIKNMLLNQPIAINKKNLTATTKSIEESNNRIIKELSGIRSLINGSSPPPPPPQPLLSHSVISGTISAAIIVSVVAILVFLWIYNNNNTGGSIKKLNHMKLWRK